MSSGWIHLTARVSPSMPSLIREDVAPWLWAHLRDAFPRALAAVLMPDHPHLLVPAEDPDGARRRLARLLGQAGRRFGVPGQASIVAEPEPIRDGQVLARQVRYVALNPCRKRLASCPLAWMWSTHRDLVGASVDPWVTAERLARALDRPRHSFAARHHAYVSADPHAHIGGTPLPLAVAPNPMATVALDTIVTAACAALRLPPAAIRDRGPARALFVALASEQGWSRPTLLAAICGCSVRTIERLTASTDPRTLPPARLCLGDPRLRHPLDERSASGRAA